MRRFGIGERLFTIALIGIAVRNIFMSIGTPSETEYVATTTSSSSMVKGGSVVLPRRLITVFGLENSGTKFLATTLGVASGSLTDPPPKLMKLRASSSDIEIQHLSLPWGPPGCEPKKSMVDMFAVVPEKCMIIQSVKEKKTRNTTMLPAYCTLEAGIQDYLMYPNRFFVNITSHILWYHEKGVDATAVILMRDSTIQSASKEKSRCLNRKQRSEEENQHGLELIREAIDKLSPTSSIIPSLLSSPLLLTRSLPTETPKVLVVSYECLMSIQKEYLFSIYAALHIDSSYVPNFKDGNMPYIKTNEKG